jgi:cytochrome c-type biogenesis protein CcmF
VRHIKGGLWERLTAQGRAYWGMQFAHVGVAVFIIGVTVVMGYEVERDVRMDIGDTSGGRRLPVQVRRHARHRRAELQRRARVGRGHEERQVLHSLHPEKRLYHVQQMPMTEAAIRTSITGDLYVSLGEPVAGGAWSVRVYYKPFVTWIWGGCVLMALGGGSAWPTGATGCWHVARSAALEGKAASA